MPSAAQNNTVGRCYPVDCKPEYTAWLERVIVGICVCYVMHIDDCTGEQLVGGFIVGCRTGRRVARSC